MWHSTVPGNLYLAFFLDIPVCERREARYEAWILDHVRHEFTRVAADVKELESVFEDEAFKDRMRRNPNAVPIAIQAFGKSDIWLHVAWPG